MRDFGLRRIERRPDVRFCGTVLQLTKGLEPRSEHPNYRSIVMNE
jgi:hypothetical protein